MRRIPHGSIEDAGAGVAVGATWHPPTSRHTGPCTRVLSGAPILSGAPKCGSRALVRHGSGGAGIEPLESAGHPPGRPRRDLREPLSMKVLCTPAPTTPGGRGIVKLERHLGCHPEETLTHAAHEVRRYPNATRGNIVVRLSPRLRHLGMRANQGSPQFTSTNSLPGQSGGRRCVCIAASRHRCVEFVRQSEMSHSSGGSGLRLGLSVLRGPTGLEQPPFSARPDYSPVRRSTGAFRPQARYFQGLAGQHHGVRADQ